MRYTLYITVNRSNGTEYDHAAMEYQGRSELDAGIVAAINLAEHQCRDETTFPPSSIVITVVPH